MNPEEVNIELNDMDIMPVMHMTEEEQDKLDREGYARILPLIPLKNMVLMPGLILPVTVGRAKSLAALQAASQTGQFIVVVTQKKSDVEEPQAEDLYDVGVVAQIVKTIQMPDQTIAVILQGRKRIHIQAFQSQDPYLAVETLVLPDQIN